MDIEEFWNLQTEDRGRTFLMNWTKAALRSRLAPLQRVARTIRGRMEGVPGFIRWAGVTSSKSEGRNNKIKMIIHRSFGFHSATSTLAMITLCCSGIRL